MTWNAREFTGTRQDLDAGYTVQKGDTIWSIAQRTGIPISDLMIMNGIRDPKRLRIGQKIYTPKFGSFNSPNTQSNMGQFNTPEHQGMSHQYNRSTHSNVVPDPFNVQANAVQPTMSPLDFAAGFVPSATRMAGNAMGRGLGSMFGRQAPEMAPRVEPNLNLQGVFRDSVHMRPSPFRGPRNPQITDPWVLREMSNFRPYSM